MLPELLGNKTAARILSFLLRFGQAHPSLIARDLAVPLNMVQKQLARFERGGFLEGRKRGRLHVYQWDKTHPLFKELRKILTVGVTLDDPADGTYLTLGERVAQAEALSREGERLSRRQRYKPFARSFNNFKSYEAWKKKQHHPWLA